MKEEYKTESGCSKECDYLFDECEADGTAVAECRANYENCIAECLVS